jgi:hypothetical protein
VAGAVAPALDRHVEREAVPVDGSPRPVLLVGGLGPDLVEVPLVAGLRPPPADPVREAPAEPERPPRHGPAAHDGGARRRHLPGRAQARREAEVAPDRVAGDLGREAVAGARGPGR